MGHCWLVEILILSILSSQIAAATRAHWWASLVRAIISSYESHFMAVNFMSVWGSGQGASAGNCFHPPSSCVDGCLSWRHSLMESRILPPSWKHSGFSPASCQQWSLMFYFHKEYWSNHGTWNNNSKHHRHCHYMPIHLNTDLRWVSP